MAFFAYSSEFFLNRRGISPVCPIRALDGGAAV